MFFVSVAPVFIHRAQILAYIKNSSYGHKKGQAIYIAPLQPNTLASVKTWGILRELAV